ncbi:hypothetical protein BX616_002069 [Lobosporangium transversale]|uniref:F-box domain-containing protein n=1 Tax=Lobosporangium transversale TaxID=64571 RepID=A0A1Y2GAA8_9FUNG|nr:hypothetical protein BCR41DRAFT_361674 [Lobosporangium transversale]KAF9917047.1 hypothetical protein BX616_002069 [Lobosporangium transversale]ORZ05484.1 hypothetical protein BCR41DRAFT_361674 [Lobosporangium transversale]|eukprot:XP_021877058.1 hypothetical protein BCR41DRAFT_361674 [Lobosporangium transversale]
MPIYRNPLDTPEIRVRVVQYLSMEDIINCSQTCKAWNNEFAAHIWHTIDLKSQPKVKELHYKSVAKNGNHIRIIKNIRKRSELVIFQDPRINKLSQLTLRLKTRNGYHHQAAELIRRNLDTLETLDLSGDDTKDERTVFALSETLVPPSSACNYQLTSITLKYMSMTRESFSILLLCCPQLMDVDIRYCTFSGDGGLELFQHERMSYLCASIEQVFKPIVDQTSTPLLVHFPNLKTWETWSFEEPLEDPTAQTLKNAILEYCPNIQKLYTNDSSSSVMCELLTKAFQNLTSVRFIYGNITTAVVLGLLLHVNTLTTIQSYDPCDVVNWSYNADEALSISDGFNEGWMIHVLLSRCPHLSVVDLPTHEMDIDMVDRFPWACKDLKRLRVRIRGLDTKELIVAAIDKWRFEHRERQRSALASLTKTEKNSVAFENTVDQERELPTAEQTISTTTAIGGADANTNQQPPPPLPQQQQQQQGEASNIVNNPIVDKVVRQLLKFEKLDDVWLGYKVWGPL